MVRCIMALAILSFLFSGPQVASAAPPYNTTDLGTLGGPISAAFGINAGGQVVGSADTASGKRHAFLYGGGKMADLGTLAGPDGKFSEALGVSDDGRVVGYSETAGGTRHAFLFDKGKLVNRNGKMKDLGALFGPASDSHAYRINASGQIVGASALNAFFYSNGKMLSLDPKRPLGAKVDYAPVDGNSFRVGWISSEAHGINDQGEVVGYAATDIGPPIRGFHAFLYSARKIIDLNTLIDPTVGWVLRDATGINDKGLIVGFGDSPAGKSHAFLLTPNRP